MNEDELERRIEDLERRVNIFNSDLARAIEQRDRLALDAAWGIVEALARRSFDWFPVAAIFAFWWWGGRVWWGYCIVSVLAYTIGAILSARAYAYASRQRIEEIGRLAELPEWEWINP